MTAYEMRISDWSSDVCSSDLSTALDNGWVWNIPLRHRRGNGYVYSSRFCTADDAERELRTHLGLLDNPVQARHLRMRVGRIERPWADRKSTRLNSSH